MNRVDLGLGLSVGAVVLSVYGLLRGQPEQPPGVAATTAAAPPSSPGDTKLATLERRLAALEAERIARGPRATAEPSKPGAPGAPDDEGDGGASATASGEPRAGADAPPKLVRFDVRGSNITVEEGERGAISVTNRDPALTGKTLIVRGFTADGEERDVTITVPPP